MQSVNYLFCLEHSVLTSIPSTVSDLFHHSLHLHFPRFFFIRSALVCERERERDRMQLCELMTEGYQMTAQRKPLCCCPGQTTRGSAGSAGSAKWWPKPHTHTLTGTKSLHQIFGLGFKICTFSSTTQIQRFRERVNTDFILIHPSFLSSYIHWSNVTGVFPQCVFVHSLGGGPVCKGWKGDTHI